MEELHESKAFLMPTVTERWWVSMCGEDKLWVTIFISLRYVDMYQWSRIILYKEAAKYFTQYNFLLPFYL